MSNPNPEATAPGDLVTDLMLHGAMNRQKHQQTTRRGRP